MAKLIGTDPNQVPTNGDLGDLAYQNKESVTIEGGTITTDTFATTSTGIDVTGTVTADGLTVQSGSSAAYVATFTNNTASETARIYVDANGIGLFDNDSQNFYDITSNTARIYTNGAKRFTAGSGGDISFYEATGTTPKFFWDASAESLGIGTSSPSEKLHVDGGGMRITPSAGENVVLTRDSGGPYFGTSSNHNMRFITNNAERMRIDSSGNVGIGTTNPVQKLNVYNDEGSLGYQTARFHSNDTSNGTRVIITNTLNTSDSGYGFITGGNLYGPGADKMSIGRFNADSTYINYSMMTFDSGGNVGIGTTSPSQKLHVVGRGIVSNGTGTSEGFSVGTSSTSTGTNFGTVDINGNSYSALYLRTNNTARFNIFQNSTAVTNINTLGSFPLAFGTNDTERMRIDSSGRVTKPYQPMFLAGRTGSSQTYTTNTPIVFNTERFDRNSNYNTSNGQFSAPVTGVYHFDSTVLVQNASSGYQFDFRLFTSNQVYYGHGRTKYDHPLTWGDGYIAFSGSWTVDMDAGDTAYIVFSTYGGGQIYGNMDWTHFSGYLVG